MINAKIAKECGRKAFYGGMKLAKDASFMSTTRKFLKEGWDDLNKIVSTKTKLEAYREVVNKLTLYIDNANVKFYLNEEKNRNINRYAALIVRFIGAMKEYGFTATVAPYKAADLDYVYNGVKSIYNAKSTADFVVKNDIGQTLMLELSMKSPSYTTRGDGMANKSSQLYMLSKMYPDCIVGEVSLHKSTEDWSKEPYDLLATELVLDAKKGVLRLVENGIFEKEAELEAYAAMYATTKRERCNDETKCKNCPYNDTICSFVPSETAKLNQLPPAPKGSGTMRFTSDQQAFINFDKGNARVLAGAGSGKTTSIIARVLNLLRKGAKPQDLLLVTFTEKGAREMAEKLDWMAEVNHMPIDSSLFKIMTFNSFGQEVLDKHYRILGYHSQPVLIDAADKIEIIKNLVDSSEPIANLNYSNPMLDMFKAKGAVIAVSKMFDYLKEARIASLMEFKTKCPASRFGTKEVVKKDIVNYHFDYDAVWEMYEKFLNIIEQNSYIEYTDQIMKAYEILQKLDDNHYNYKHIVVDEFQDSDNWQVEIIKLLSEKPGNESVVVVGDDAQSIFSWRGVNMHGIIQFPEKFTPCTEFVLTDNFRSTKEILDLANNAIALSASNLPKNLVAHKNGVKPKLVSVDKNEMVHEMLKRIAMMHKNGTPLQDIAVISRRKQELFDLALLLKKARIPYVMSVSEFLHDNAYIKAIDNLLTFATDLENTSCLLKYLRVEDPNLFDSAMDLKSFVITSAKIITEKKLALSEDEYVQYIVGRFKNLAEQEAAVQLLLDAVEERNICTVAQLSKFVHQLVMNKTDISISYDEARYEAVTLTTVHAAKGREFKTVIMPDAKAYHEFNKSGDDESIRLLFVAITRAMDDLWIISDMLTDNETDLVSKVYKANCHTQQALTKKII